MNESQLLRQACEIYRMASDQNHNKHFYRRNAQGDIWCSECIRARELRNQADALMEQIHVR